MRKKSKMDSIGSTNLHYKNIYNISSAIMLLLLQAYIMLIIGGFDCFNFSNVENPIMRYFLQIFVQIIIFSVSYSLIFFAIKKIYSSNWIKNHKNIWLKGTWVHIHVKKDFEIRVGFVDIYQNFYTIKAKANNMYPDIPGISEQRETAWDYVMGKVFEDDYKRDFIGVYEAMDMFNHIPRNGIHSLKIEIGGDGFPNMMVGKFGDTIELCEDKNNSNAGQLYMFKLSEKCSKYFELGNRNTLLYDIHTVDDYLSEPYVCKLNSIINDLCDKKANQ